MGGGFLPGPGQEDSDNWGKETTGAGTPGRQSNKEHGKEPRCLVNCAAAGDGTDFPSWLVERTKGQIL